MPIQTGNMPAKGAMNNMSYYKTKDGALVKMKSIIPKESFKTAKFENTRKHQFEFGLAGKASKTLRDAVSTIIHNCKDQRVSSRLTTLMFRISKTDTTNVFGQRNPTDGQLELLNGFDLNVNAPLSLNFLAPFTVDIDRAAGTLSLAIPSFNPGILLANQGAATHFKILSAGCEADFKNEKHNTQTFETDFLPVGDQPTADINIVHNLAANSVNPLFLFLGIQYFLDVNGGKTLIHNSKANSMAILSVEEV